MRFSVDAQGALTAQDGEAKGALAERAGAFELTPTSPDWMLFLRSPVEGGAAPSPRVVLAGDASGFPLSDLIAFLSQSRWTGTVRVHTPGGERTLGFKEGEVRGALSDDPAHRLGEVIVRLGYLERARLEEVLKEDGPGGKIGRILVERGVLQAHDLWKCVTEQVSDIFHSIVLCREGAFVLLDQEFEDKSSQALQLSTQSLLMDAIRKIDELAHFRKRIPHSRIYVGAKRASDGKLEPEEDRVLALANGHRTVQELGHRAKLSEFDVTKVIFRLLEGGYAAVNERPIEVAAAPAPTAPAGADAPSEVARSEASTIVRVFNAIFREIRDEVAKQQMEKEFLAAANAALAGQALSSSPVLKGLSFDPTGGLDDQVLLQQFERAKPQLGSAPGASLRKALSDVMFFLLFQAGELLESRADEDLARRVKALLATIDAD